jgi:LysR family glycine cleavage system transcriptional activator
MNTLRLFEAAARLGSFKQAAEEVNVTPSAVSHGLRTLEQWLGAELFYRDARGLTLTQAGKAYAVEVQRALTILAGATEGFPGRRKSTGTLSVSVAPTFANRWLLPRLPKFTERHPSIRISIDTARRHVDFLTEGFDLAIRMAQAPRSNESWTELVAESFVPVCSPHLMRRMGATHSRHGRRRGLGCLVPGQGLHADAGPAIHQRRHDPAGGGSGHPGPRHCHGAAPCHGWLYR